MSICIRAVRQEDAPAFAELVRELGDFSSVTQEAPAVTLQRAEQSLAVITSSDSHTLLAAEENGELVGYCSAHWIPMMSRLSCFISELFAKASYWNRGIGTKLVESVKTEARARGAGRLHLENFRTKESYERSYYAKHGWQERTAAASFILDLREEAP